MVTETDGSDVLGGEGEEGTTDQRIQVSTGSWKRPGVGFSLQSLQKEPALSAPWFYHCKTNFGLLTSRNIGE